MNINLTTEIPVSPEIAFDILLEELNYAFGQMGISFEHGSEGRISQDHFIVGRVQAWERGHGFSLEWRAASWNPDEVSHCEVRMEPTSEGCRVTLAYRGTMSSMADGKESTSWFASEIAARMMEAIMPDALGDWITDRHARRPWGEQSRMIYRDPLYHLPGFRAILKELALRKEDHLLDIGCGGGAMLKDALRSGCRATGIDHSPDMVRLAKEVNQDSIEAGKLEVREADAHALPFQDNSFSCATMHGVLGFLRQPERVFSEIRRVLKKGGRFITLGSDPKLRGTPAAPEPIASRLRFYTDTQLQELARQAGFDRFEVIQRGLEAYAREVGIPSEHLALFSGPGTSFLFAVK